ncbi:MAG: DUF2232 domain-containing protein [Candidatus Zixiibacteriota bacterium]
MTGSNRQPLEIACACAIAIAFPLSILVPLLNPLLVFGLAALYFLWFARSITWLLGAVAVGLAILATLGEPGHLAYFLIGVFIPGMSLAITRRMGWGLAASLVAACVVPVAAVAIYHDVFAKMIFQFGEQLRAIVAAPQFSQLYPPDEYQRAVTFMDTMATNAPHYVPGALLASLVFLFAIAAVLGEVLLARAGIFSYRVPPFTMWKLDEWMVLPVGIAFIMVLTTEPLFDMIGWNTLLFLFLLFSVFGLSFLEYQMRTRGFPLPVKIVIYFFLFIAQIIAGIVLPLIALFDAKFDFRKIRAKQLG